MERAVPSIIFIAWSILVAFRSGIFFSAICFTCSLVRTPTLVLLGSAEPFFKLMVCLIRSATGAVFSSMLKDLSSKIVTWAGTDSPLLSLVSSLYLLTKSIIGTPC